MTCAQHAENITADGDRLDGSLLTSFADHSLKHSTAFRCDPDELVIEDGNLCHSSQSTFDPAAVLHRLDDCPAPPAIDLPNEATVVDVEPFSVALASTLQEHQLVLGDADLHWLHC
jgi:hypothetical protein